MQLIGTVNFFDDVTRFYLIILSFLSNNQLLRGSYLFNSIYKLWKTIP